MQAYYILENKISDFIINVFYNQSLVYGYKDGIYVSIKLLYQTLKILRTKTICLPHQIKFLDRQSIYSALLIEDTQSWPLLLIIKIMDKFLVQDISMMF